MKKALSFHKQRLRFFQNLADQPIFASKGKALFFGTVSIQTADCLLPEIDRDVKDQMNTPDQDMYNDESHPFLVARSAFPPLQVVVMPIHGFQTRGLFVLLNNGIIHGWDVFQRSIAVLSALGDGLASAANAR